MKAAMARSVIFDFDGVLVNSEIIALNELRICLNELGISVEFKDMTSHFLGSSFEDIAAFVTRRKGRIDTEAFRAAWYDRLFNRYRTELAVMNGVADLLGILDARGHSYCIASGGSYRRLNFALDVTGLARVFEDRAFSADSVARGKPEPDIFLFAADRLGVPPEQCLVVEDAIAGVQAARSAGMTPVGFVGGAHLDNCRQAHGARLKAAGAVTIIDSLLDVPELLSQR